MAFDRGLIKMHSTVPEGFGIVRTGAIRPDDLVFVYPGGGWLRHDSPDWLSKVDFVSDAVGVCRAGYRPPPSANPERIKIDKRPPTPKTASPDLQRSLF